MMALLSAGLLLRSNSKLVKLPPYLSILCVVVGVAWLLLLPLQDYSRRTYVSENALLPGQVHTYFAGSDQNIFRGFKHEVDALENANNTEINDKLDSFLTAAGLKTARQSFEYTSSGIHHAGQNLYAVLNAPRGDATEAIVLIGAWRNMEGILNRSGIALVLTLARYFKRWSLWSKDIIFLITPDSQAGPQAWVDAYHDAHDPRTVQSLPLKSGALQGALAVDYPFDHRFEKLHIVYDGINGQLPNLDLFNTITNIAQGQMGIPVSLQQMWHHDDSYQERLQTMLRGMLRQALGHGSGPHSSFIPYHVDAVTLQPYGEGWQDEMAMGRVVESTVRSLNNLLEHLHQSFFFYLLMHSQRFVSIGTYLPSAMLVAVSFTIMAIWLWVQTGRVEVDPAAEKAVSDKNKKMEVVRAGSAVAIVPAESLDVQERHLFAPLAVVVAVQFLGMVPLMLFNHAPQNILRPTFGLFAAGNAALPILLSAITETFMHLTPQQYQLLKSFSLLLLGIFLSSLATLNFSLAFFIGLLSSPLIFVQPLRSRPALALAYFALLLALAPAAVIHAGAWYWTVPLEEVLTEAAFGWNVVGMYTQFVVCCVWWPAWVVGATVVLSKPEVGNRA